MTTEYTNKRDGKAIREDGKKNSIVQQKLSRRKT
jgi:hypothetical protein